MVNTVYGGMLSPEEAENRLRENGAHMTAQRKSVLDVLAGNRSHPTVEAIVSAVRDKLGYVSPATIYNTLDALERLGFVRRIEGLEDKAHFDPDTSDHQHAICRNCGRVWDVDTFAEPIGLPDGFIIQNILIQGTCAECASDK